jgi:nitrogen fixation NifU-like protein
MSDSEVPRPDAKTLYRQVLLDHGHHPRNLGPLTGCTHEATVENALCGDRVTLRLRVEEGEVAEVRFEARGCLVARASASILTEAVAGRSVERAEELARVIDALVGSGEPAEDLGALEPLRGVRDFPARRACVALVWTALRGALAGHTFPPAKRR